MFVLFQVEQMTNRRIKRPTSPIGLILREIRQEQGLSIQAVADVCDVHPNSISAFERSRHTQLDSIEQIAEALGYELDVILKPD